MTIRRMLGGRSVAAVGLGCMSLSHGYGRAPDRATSVALLNRALDLGYDHLDTARLYGLGHNEALIGEALRGRRREYFLASKCGIIADGDRRRIDCSPAAITAALDASLAALQTDHIDLYYMHRRDVTVPIEESMAVLAEAVKAGKIGAIGLSEMSADTLRRAAAVHPVAAMQTEYSPWTREAEIAVLDACADLGTTFVAFSPVGRGALAGGVPDPAALAENDMRRAMPRFQGENWISNQRLIARFAAIANDVGVTPAQLALGWVLARGSHIVVIPGTANISHLEENFARADWLPDAATVARVDEVVNRHTVAGSRYPEAMQRSIDTEMFA
ncbi:aldo/keto reductase [Sandarakinorhabdus rubra]|uniref:aldo/keto reductase n=1 Tax=Sandarakinorhabdus rubra TaxID=2672568 RepID=UPI0013DC2735|nr:aldo/keto reductase [Sandarakinorhabdus rubra]